MANVVASFLGYAYYNNGWNPSTNTASDFYTTATALGLPIMGKSNYWRYGVFKISLPAITGPSAGRHLYFNMSLYSGSVGNASFYVTVAKVGRSTSDDKGGGKEATYPSSSDIIISSQPVTCYMSSSGYNRVAFDFDASALPSTGGTYYIWLWGNSLLYFRYNASDTAQTFVCSLTYTPYTACTAPTSLSLNKTREVPGGTATLSWSGAKAGTSTTISGYNIYYRDYTASGIAAGSWSYLKTVTTSSTSGSVSVEVSPTRGYSRYFAIYTLCAQGSAYNSGQSNSSAAFKTNRLPYFTSTSLSQTTFPSTGGTFTVSWSAGVYLGTLQVLIYVPGFDEGTYTTATGTAGSFTTSDSKYVRFTVTDGLESVSQTLYYTINTVPTISNFSITPNTIAGNSSIALASTISGSGTPNKTNVKYYWLLYTNSVTTTISNSASLVNYDISNLVSRGNTYQIGLKVNDGYDDSTISWSATYRRPYLLGSPAIVGLYNGGTTSSPITISGTQSNQYGSSYFLKIKNPTVSDGYPNISKIEVKTTWGVYRFSSTTSAAQQTIQINGSTVTPGEKDNIIVTVTSASGETSTASGSITRAVIPAFSGTSLTMTGPKENNKIGIRPFTNTSSVTYSCGTGNYSQCQNGFKWYIGYSYNNKTPLTTSFTPTSISGSTMTYTLSAATVNSTFLNSYFESSSGIFNADYDLTVSLYAMDNFGQTSDVLYFSDAALLYIEAPVMNATEAKIGINYVPSSSSTSYMVEVGTSATNDARMINDGESIYLNLDTATDYNNDLSGYLVYVAELDSAPTKSSTTLYASYFSDTAAYPINSFYPTVSVSSGKATLQYTLGSYSAHKFLVFQIWAVDKGGRTSKKCAYSSTYLIACHKAIPQLRIDSASLRTESGTTTKNYLDVQINISDLGDCYNEGAVLSSSYIKNFERSITANSIAYTSIMRMVVEVTYSLQEDFPSDSSLTKTASITLQSDFHGYNGSFSIELTDSNFVGKRLYLKARVSVTTGYGTSTLGGSSNITYVTNSSPSFVYFTIMPTVAYRNHYLGINTNAFDTTTNDEIIRISDTETRGIIRLTGTETSSSTAQDHEIIVNLKEGTITGDNIYSVKIVKWTSS